MLNINSPIVNNMMGGAGYMPANPIGNVMSMGIGYNNMGGYYGGSYNYVSPYMIQQQQQAYMAKVREQQRLVADSMKAVARIAAVARGEVIDEDYLSQRYDPSYDQPLTQQEQTQDRLMKLHLSSMVYDPDTMRINYMNRLYDNYKQKVPDNISLADFFDTANSELAAIERNELKMQQRRGIKDLYNSDEYKQLISMHSKSSSYFNNIYNNNANCTSIDDMEVNIPVTVSPYHEKRRRFMEMIGMRTNG